MMRELLLPAVAILPGVPMSAIIRVSALGFGDTFTFR
jgi:hypothetical protein